MKIQMVLCSTLLLCIFFIQSAEAKVNPIYSTLQKGSAVELNDKNYFYIFGLVSNYMEQCAWPYQESKVSTQTFLESAKNRYSTETSKMTMQTVIGEQAEISKSVEAGKQDVQDYLKKNDCGQTKFTAALRDTMPSVQKSKFVTSCIEQTGYAPQCECIANIGQTIIPNFYDQEYSQPVIRRMIETNPIKANMVGVLCK